MAVGNGDERQAAAWERVEAKLDQFGEKVDRLEGKVDRLEGFAETAELRLKRLEDNGELIRLLIEAVRREVDEKIERFEERLLSKLGREMHVELLAAQTLNGDRVARLERRVDALEAAKA